MSCEYCDKGKERALLNIDGYVPFWGSYEPQEFIIIIDRG